jgi:hypothetical protein
MYCAAVMEGQVRPALAMLLHKSNETNYRIDAVWVYAALLLGTGFVQCLILW